MVRNTNNSKARSPRSPLGASNRSDAAAKKKPMTKKKEKGKVKSNTVAVAVSPPKKTMDAVKKKSSSVSSPSGSLGSFTRLTNAAASAPILKTDVTVVANNSSVPSPPIEPFHRLQVKENGKFANRQRVIRDFIFALELVDSAQSMKLSIDERVAKTIQSLEEEYAESGGKVHPNEIEFIRNWIVDLEAEDDECNDTSDTSKLRSMMEHLFSIRIPKTENIHPKRLERPFVTGFAVVIAFLTVFKDFNICFLTDTFVLDQTHKIDEIADCLVKAGWQYPNAYNVYTDAKQHVYGSIRIGQFLRTHREKIRKYGTWTYVNGKVYGNDKGLYHDYKKMFDMVGIPARKKTGPRGPL